MTRGTKYTAGLAALTLVFGIHACQAERAERADEMAETTQEAESAAFSVERTVSDLRTPESVRPGPDGRYYVSEIGAFGEPDGRITAYDPETWEASVVTDEVNDPKGLAFWDGVLHVTDVDRIVAIGPDGASVKVAPDAFPEEPIFLNDLVVGPDGALYVSDSGDFEADDGAVYRINPDGAVETVIRAEDAPDLASPNGLTFDPRGRLLAIDLHTGKLVRLGEDGATLIAQGFGGGDGLEFAPDGSLYASDFESGRIFRVSFVDDTAQVEQVAQIEGSAADIGLDARRGRLLAPQLMQNTLTVVRLP